MALATFAVPLSAEPIATIFPGQAWATAEPAAMGVDPERLQEAIDYFAGYCGEQSVSEMMVIRHGRVIWAGENTESQHPVWSVSKSFCAVTAGLLYDDGLISPKTKLAELVPAYAEYYPEVTVHHCLSLTDGFSNQDWNQLDKVSPPLFPPGEYFHYAPGVNPLARAMTAAAGEELSELFKRRIADPIGMQHWRWGHLAEENGIKINGAAGQPESALHTTASDLARLGLLLLNEGEWNGQPLLSAEWIELATRPQAGPAIPAFDADAWYNGIIGAYGYLFWVNGVQPGGERIWPAAPPETFALQGNRNNICWVIPEWDMVIVRTGTDKIAPNEANRGLFERLAPGVRPTEQP